MAAPTATPTVRLLAAALSVLVCLFVLFAPFETLRQVLPGDGVVERNTAMLQDARAASLNDLVLLAELDALVAVAASIDVGVSLGATANLDVGAALRPIENGLERGIVAAIAGASFYEFSLIFVELAHRLEPVALKLFAAATIPYALGLLFLPKGPARRAFHLAFEVALVVLVVTRLVVPYGVAASGMIVGSVADAALSDAQAQISTLHGKLAHTNGEPMSIESWQGKKSAHQTFQRIASDFPQNLELFTRYAIRRVMISLLEGIVLPLVFLLGGVVLYRATSRRLRQT